MGPGRYPNQSQFKTDAIKKQNAAFMPQCARFMAVELPSGDPGNYFDGDTTAVSWNKKSFNIRFAEY